VSNPSANIEGVTRAARPHGTGLTSRLTITGTSSDVKAVKVVALVPAHNEEEQIAATIQSLLAQNIPVQVVISADNCTDATVEIASSFQGVIVAETVDNTAKKAGALNQAWERYGRDADFVFTMDADTFLAPDCLQRLIEDMPGRGAVCVWPCLKPTTTTRRRDRLMYRMVRLEFGGMGRIIHRRRFQTEVLSGMGAMFRGDVLREVADQNGTPWSTDSIVEDYRISLDIRRLGHQIAVCPRAKAYTDALVDIRSLWRQRIRWAGGTWQELFRHGWKPYTRRVWISVLLTLGGLLLRGLILGLWGVTLALHTSLRFEWFWMLPLVIAMLDGLDTLRFTPETDTKDLLLSVALLPMEGFVMLREAWTAWSLGRSLRRKGIAW
jgi:poly-beta-1,6-N-acetyl-D-glucosamine synthase